jgi:VanZ family protein
MIGLLGATVAAALALASLLPTKWVPRTGLGWEDEHFIVYFATTIVLSLASRRPYVVGVALMMFAGVLEACQGLTPDRFPDVTSALSGVAGVISAASLVNFLIWARRRLPTRSYLRPCRQWLQSVPTRKWRQQPYVLRRAIPNL